MSLDVTIQARLLGLARSTLTSILLGGEPPPEAPWPDLPPCGVFVTLRKGRALRGCIGTFTPEDDLPATIRRMAASALRDPRFLDRPVSAAELPALRIDLSLLSPLQPIDDPTAFEIGRHGIYIRQGGLVGCFLPEVAIERGWDQATFLTQCCVQKAGLEPDAWQDPETEVSIFTVERISE
jgi:AmmeMemoRadiSam system protein A